MFYPAEEFEAQMAELTAQGYPDDVAYDMVREQERKDEAEYNEWRREEELIHAHDHLERDWDEPYEPVTGCDPAEYDNWYDEQYELDTDYL